MGGCCCCASKSTELNRSPPFFHDGDCLTSHDVNGVKIRNSRIPIISGLWVNKTRVRIYISQARKEYPVSEEREPLSSHHATASAVSAGLLVDTNLDTSVPDTYRPPPAPIPFETYVRRSPTPSGNRESSGNKTEVVLGTVNDESVEDTNSGFTLETKVKNLVSGEEAGTNAELSASQEVKDEKSDELKKSNEPMVPPLQDEEDVCPTCLEEYDAENPKIITKCDHHFHLACILEWMERSDTCPVCDQEMVFSPVIGG